MSAKRIPISAAKDLAKRFGQTHVVIFTSDDKTQHVVTYGRTAEQSGQAADAGNRLKRALGWPDDLHQQPSRVRRLQARIKELEAQLAAKGEAR